MKKLLFLQWLLIVCGIISSALEKRDVHRIILREDYHTRPHRSNHHRHQKHHNKNEGHDYRSEEFVSYESLEDSDESSYKHKDYSSRKPNKSHSSSHSSRQKFRSKRQKHHKSSDRFPSNSFSTHWHNKHSTREHQHTKLKPDFFENSSYFPDHGNHFSGFTYNQKVSNIASPNSDESSFVPSKNFAASFVNKTTTYRVYEDPKYEDFPPFTQKPLTLPPPTSVSFSFSTNGKKLFDEVHFVPEQPNGSKNNNSLKKNAAILRQRRKKIKN